MKFLSILATLLAGTSVVAALPSDANLNNSTIPEKYFSTSTATTSAAAATTTATHSLSKRLTVLDPPPRTVTCGGRTYSAADIAASALAAHARRTQPVGTGRYPHAFRNMEGLRGFNRACNPRLFQEFPLRPRTSIFTGGASPGADRVVVNFVGGDVRYCGAITHTGAPRRNGFVACSPIFR